MSCELCEAVNDRYRIVLEDKFSFAMIIREPQVELHSLVLPKRHVTSFSDLTPEESVSLHRMMSDLQKKIEEVLGSQCTVMVNSPEYATQPHIHYQLIPANAGVRTFVSAVSHVPERKKVAKDELESMANTIRKA